MLSAIVLNLLFHLGLRRTARLVLAVQGDPGTADIALADAIRRSAASGKIDGATAERAREVAEQTIHLVEDGHLADGPIAVDLSYDEVTLGVCLAYRGDLLNLPTRRPISEDNLIEEQPFVKGLAGFLAGVYPDRARTSADEGQCRIELVFDVRARLTCGDAVPRGLA
jgi:hypothetical protein